MASETRLRDKMVGVPGKYEWNGSVVSFRELCTLSGDGPLSGTTGECSGPLCGATRVVSECNWYSTG